MELDASPRPRVPRLRLPRRGRRGGPAGALAHGPRPGRARRDRRGARAPPAPGAAGAHRPRPAAAPARLRGDRRADRRAGPERRGVRARARRARRGRGGGAIDEIKRTALLLGPIGLPAAGPGDVAPRPAAGRARDRRRDVRGRRAQTAPARARGRFAAADRRARHHARGRRREAGDDPLGALRGGDPDALRRPQSCTSATAPGSSSRRRAGTTRPARADRGAAAAGADRAGVRPRAGRGDRARHAHAAEARRRRRSASSTSCPA